MSIRKNIGGDRLGSGAKLSVDMRTYERSTHDLGYIWRSTMSAGTLVPFLTEIALPGDTFDIKLNCDIKTHPTVGPLFGSYKVQLDVFQIPIRLYQALLQNNKLNVGLNMAAVKLPLVEVAANNLNWDKPDLDNQQINPSCLLSYLNIRGLGWGNFDTVARKFNAIPFLAYWDIYKNYYANKQEEVGAVIHFTPEEGYVAGSGQITIETGQGNIPLDEGDTESYNINWDTFVDASIPTDTTVNELDPDRITIKFYGRPGQDDSQKTLGELFGYDWTYTDNAGVRTWVSTNLNWTSNEWLYYAKGWVYTSQADELVEPKVQLFQLDKIDTMREAIMAQSGAAAFEILKDAAPEPYKWVLQEVPGTQGKWNKQYSQEGLALKTYQSDLFNNWLQTEWIDGDNGISAITAIDTTSGEFTIDTLNLSKKVYDMLNRIAISGGSYDDWLEAVYTHDRIRRAESPMYMGGLIKELVFQEVVSNALAGTKEEQPLGTLAGKGVMGNKHKGGYITVKVDEPSYIMGIVSLTPRVDYSQGNKWDVNLKTMDDLHKPALDEIGFQDLITEQMAAWDVDASTATPVYKSAGKQPAWINYMTNVNQVRGNFAIASNEMFMTLNRRYEPDTVNKTIKDLTTYIDPVKFNHIFAQTSRDAQNFWTQISVDMTARRKMSAKIMPNL